MKPSAPSWLRFFVLLADVLEMISDKELGGTRKQSSEQNLPACPDTNLEDHSLVVASPFLTIPSEPEAQEVLSSLGRTRRLTCPSVCQQSHAPCLVYVSSGGSPTQV